MNDVSSDPKVAEEIKRELDRIGDDTRKAFDGLEKAMADLRSADAETKKYADVVTDEKERKLRADFVARHETLAEQLKVTAAAVKTEFDERLKAEVDKIEVALRRTGAFDGQSDEEAKAEVKSATYLKRVRLARDGKLSPHALPEVDQADVEESRLQRKAVLRYARRYETGMSPEEYKALTTGSDPQGGYLVTPVISNRIITKLFETSPIRQLATVEQIGTDKMTFAVDIGEAGAGWVGEEEARPETAAPGFATVDIEAKELYAKPRVTQVLLEDASIDLEQWLGNKIGDKFARVANTGYMVGNGVKQPRGILTYPSGVNTWNQVLQVASGNATAITADSIVSLPWKILDAYRQRGVFMIRRSSMPTLVTFKDVQGQYLYGAALRGQTLGDTLAGFPLYLADDMPDIGAGTTPVLFGDIRTAYTIVDRLGITMLRDPYSAKPYVEFYARLRTGGALVNGAAVVLLLVST